MKPTLHITNWSSRKLHGPGRKWTIMAKPRAWEWGDGQVPSMMPAEGDLDAARSGRIDLAEYRRRFEAKLGEASADLVELLKHIPGADIGPIDISPGKLVSWARFPGGWTRGVVSDGDTLCCACSKDEAAAGRCHRVWAAEWLAKAGWHVILDGKDLDGGPLERAFKALLPKEATTAPPTI